MALRVAIVPASAIAAKGGKLDARSYTHPFAEPDDKREARLFAGGEPRHLRCFQGPDGGQLVYFNNKYRNTLARYMPRVGHFGLLYTARRRVVGAAFHSAASLGVSLERTSVDGVLSIEWEGTSPGLGRKNQRPYDYQLGRAIEFDELDKPFAEAVVRAYRELWQLTATPGPDIFSRVVAAVPKRLT